MAAKVLIKSGEKTYTLAYTVRSVKDMERRGFAVNLEKPLTTITSLFYGALLAYHPDMLEDEADALLSEQTHTLELVQVLSGMYNDVFQSLGLSQDDKKKDISTPTWTVA